MNAPGDDWVVEFHRRTTIFLPRRHVAHDVVQSVQEDSRLQTDFGHPINSSKDAPHLTRRLVDTMCLEKRVPKRTKFVHIAI